MSATGETTFSSTNAFAIGAGIITVLIVIDYFVNTNRTGFPCLCPTIPEQEVVREEVVEAVAVDEEEPVGLSPEARAQYRKNRKRSIVGDTSTSLFRYILASPVVRLIIGYVLIAVVIQIAASAKTSATSGQTTGEAQARLQSLLGDFSKRLGTTRPSTVSASTVSA